MGINSYSFLAFFPIVTLFYFIIPHKARRLWLLAASVFFYMCWNVKFIFPLAWAILTSWGGGLLLARSRTRKQKAAWTAAVIFVNAASLAVFKYCDFFMLNINRVFAHLGVHAVAPRFDILLPIGISFYTFQIIAYIVDVYRGKAPAERNLVKYALFVAFFPKIAIGPIERTDNLLVQLDEQHSFDFERMKSGLLLMLWGYFEKEVIADRLAILVNTVFDHYQNYAGFVIIVASVAYAFQLYGDFAGYTHIALGAAEVLGFRLLPNFNSPYMAGSIQDFWRRWHISLLKWLTDYIFMPLNIAWRGIGRLGTVLATMATFLISGLWHGSAWHFIVWGGLHGVYMSVGFLTQKRRKKIRRALGFKDSAFGTHILQTIFVFALVCVSYIFFRAPSLHAALHIGKSILHYNPWILFDGTLYKLGLDTTEYHTALYALIVLLAVDWTHYFKPDFCFRQAILNQNLLFRWVVYIAAIMLVLVFGIYGPSYNPQAFVYFKF